VQASTDIAIATKIAEGLKTGGLPGIKAFKKLTVVGHSYGSAQTKALTAVPGLVDHAVLTGFAAEAFGGALFITGAGLTPANEVDPDRFGSLPHSYLMTVAPQTFQTFFLQYPFFTAAAGRLSRATEEPVTQGALFTSSASPDVVKTYNGSITVVTAQKDVIMCGGNCLDVPMGLNVTSLLDTVKPLYPAASNFTTYMPKNMGHGISAHNESGTVHVWIQNHLASL
jgi:pimeloyl-ACP methyl ester carboxylesterase